MKEWLGDVGLIVMSECSELHDATEGNDREKVAELLQMLPNLSKTVDSLGRTALHVACKIGNLGVAETILQHTANINAQDSSGKTSLHFCTTVDFVYLLCDAGANPNIRDDQGNTPLHIAAMTGDVACARVLLRCNADPTVCDSSRHRNVLHVAVSVGNTEFVLMLLEESRFPINIDAPDIDGNSAMHLAASCTSPFGQQQRMMLLLLEKGASPLATNLRAVSALHFVCANRYLCTASLAEPLVEILLELDADPNAMDIEGCTPLLISVAHREWSICKLLLQAGGDLNIPCPMNSLMLQQGTAYSSNAENFLVKSECTASDLMPRKARSQLFPCICVPQTHIPPESRDHCMNCGAMFRDLRTRSLLSFLSSGKHHCRMCNRVICQDCSPHFLPLKAMPKFIRDSGTTEDNFRLCRVCFSCLIPGSSV